MLDNILASIFVGLIIGSMLSILGVIFWLWYGDYKRWKWNRRYYKTEKWFEKQFKRIEKGN